MVLHTCERMAAGGIHDQLGGGFARYSVDAEWLVPHFEKMLYDNAQLVQLYLDAHLISEAQIQPEGRVPRVPEPTSLGLDELVPPNETSFATTARDILDYVLRDMTHPDGGFYSAEDADSEGHEGKFYCWTKDELSRLLTVEEFNVAAKYFGITAEGNFVDHSHPSPLPGQNVLSIVNPLTRPSDTLSPSDEERDGVRGSPISDDSNLLASAKAKMLATRARRVRPQRDDKILASWNGLMLGAFARAAAVLDDEKYRTAAEKNLRFIREKLWVQHAADPDRAAGILPADQTNSQNFRQDAGNTLFHRWRDGERDNVQLLEGYAFLLDGVIQLYEATLKPAHLDFAIELAEAMIAKFYDPANGGFWQSAAGTDDLILRVKDDYDGAEQSGNSVATLALLKLAAITSREDFRQPAEATLQLFAARLENQPAAMAFMLQALDFWLDEPRRVVIAGDQRAAGILPAEPSEPGNIGPSEGKSAARFQKLLHAAHSVYQPNKIVLGNTGVVEPFAKTLPTKGDATVYICTGTMCLPPTSDAAKMKDLLS
jgi:uncharacterized protein YyaL (SSP411 family)